MIFFRYVGATTYKAYFARELKLLQYNLISETPKGYWIENGYKKRWVSKTATKRFAYPTKEEAMQSFIARKKSQINILRAQMNEAEVLLYMAENNKSELSIADYNSLSIVSENNVR